MQRIALFTLAGTALDALLGEPRRWHPLVGFGALAHQVEILTEGSSVSGPVARKARGILAVSLLLGPAWAITRGLEQLPWLGQFASIAGLYLALGARSLIEHGRDVARALTLGDITRARWAVSRIVSRNTDELDETGIAAATVESVLENGCDAIFGALFWFMVAGLPGVVLFRLANTLDAMWGYRNQRYQHFGWAAARLDDVLNYIPARLTALSYLICGHAPTALKAWRHQAPVWKSPNAGPVMAAGAGALQLQLGGTALYHGISTQRPDLGYGKPPEAIDIERAIALVQRALGLWLVIISLAGLMHA